MFKRALPEGLKFFFSEVGRRVRRLLAASSSLGACSMFALGDVMCSVRPRCVFVFRCLLGASSVLALGAADNPPE